MRYFYMFEFDDRNKLFRFRLNLYMYLIRFSDKL